MDYFFTNIKPAPIIVTCPAAHQNKPTLQQAETRDPISQQTHPSQPGKTRVYPSMLTNVMTDNIMSDSHPGENIN